MTDIGSHCRWVRHGMWAAIAVVVIVSQTNAGKRYAVANGNWDVTSTWSSTSGGSSGASVPTSSDTVYIGEGGVDRTVTIPTGYAAVCASLIMGSSSTSRDANLTFAASTSSLTVAGDVDMKGPNAGKTRNLTVNAGMLTAPPLRSILEQSTPAVREQSHTKLW